MYNHISLITLGVVLPLYKRTHCYYIIVILVINKTTVLPVIN